MRGVNWDGLGCVANNKERENKEYNNVWNDGETWRKIKIGSKSERSLID